MKLNVSAVYYSAVHKYSGTSSKRVFPEKNLSINILQYALPILLYFGYVAKLYLEELTPHRAR
jgi:hypothetical protein